MSTPPRRGALSLHRFECPVLPVIVTKKISDEAGQALLVGNQGRCWLVELDNPSIGSSPRIVQGSLNLTADGKVTDYDDLLGDRVLVTAEYAGREWDEVLDIRKGCYVFSKQAAERATMTPNGSHLLLFDENGIDVADMRRPAARILRTGLLPVEAPAKVGSSGQLEYDGTTLDNPFSAMAVASSKDVSTFTLAVGDYGFAVVTELTIDESGGRPSVSATTPKMFAEGLIYDIVEIVDLVPHRWLVVRHGMGCGLSRFDLQSGSRFDCPLPKARSDPHYGAFRQVVASSRSDGYWVKTDVGPYYWDGDGELREVHEDACQILATDGDSYLGLSADGLDLIHGRL